MGLRSQDCRFQDLPPHFSQPHVLAPEAGCRPYGLHRACCLSRMAYWCECWGAESYGIVNPLLAEGYGSLAFGDIGGVGTVLAIDGNVDDVSSGLLHGGPKLHQIFGVGGRGVSGPRLDLVDAKFFLHVRGEVFEVDL